MDRTFESGAAGSPPSAPASPSTGYPTAGNPSLAVPATKPGPWWYHMMTEELRAVIVAAGLTPDHTDVTQLSQAIQAMIIANQKAVVINNAIFEASVSDGEVVRWDSANSRFDEAVADGTGNNRAVGIADVTNSKVYLYGECPLFVGLTPGARYYLDASTPGAMTTTAPTDAVMVGIAKSATTLWCDFDAFSAVEASETVKGIVELATDAEAQAFTTNKIIDGAKLAMAFKGANQSLASDGYQKLPGGLILQWGSGYANPATTVTYPIAFPNSMLSLTVSTQVVSDGGFTGVEMTYTSESQFTATGILNSGSTNVNFKWIAIGF